MFGNNVNSELYFIYGLIIIVIILIVVILVLDKIDSKKKRKSLGGYIWRYKEDIGFNENNEPYFIE